MSFQTREEKIMTVLQGPHLSEKSHISAEQNQIVFKVSTDATKRQIKKAVETLFDVKVSAVKTVSVKGKKKRSGMRMGTTKAWKKAYVIL